jgi:signal transduction histidine kinase
MNKHYKLFILFSILIALFFSIRLYQESLSIKKIKDLSVQYEAKSIADFMIAFRQTYQNIFIKNHLLLDESNIDFLPVRTQSDIAQIFSELNTKSQISTVSDRPRNINNLANDRQLDTINFFKNNKNEKYNFQQINNKYYYSQPLYITKTCLKCHGKKEDAPAIIKNQYDKAYGYKLGELRGIIEIEIEQTELGTILDSNLHDEILFVTLFVILLLIIIFIYVRKNKKLEDELRIGLEESRKKDLMIMRNNKLAIMGEMIAMIAHQWKQPLAGQRAIIGNIKIKKRLNKLTDNNLDKNLMDIDKLLVYMSNTIDDFANFFKPTKEKRVINIKDEIAQSIKIIEGVFKNNSIDVSVKCICDNMECQNCSKKFMIELYDREFKQVMINMLTNAKDALIENKEDNRVIKITVENDDTNIKIYVADNAGGVPEEIISQVFEPYFSTKAKNGTGLGLYMSKTIIEEHLHGKLSVKNNSEGAIFIIELPLN